MLRCTDCGWEQPIVSERDEPKLYECYDGRYRCWTCYFKREDEMNLKVEEVVK